MCFKLSLDIKNQVKGSKPIEFLISKSSETLQATITRAVIIPMAADRKRSPIN